mgnify:CR=1 FL=1
MNEGRKQDSAILIHKLAYLLDVFFSAFRLDGDQGAAIPSPVTHFPEVSLVNLKEVANDQSDRVALPLFDLFWACFHRLDFKVWILLGKRLDCFTHSVNAYYLPNFSLGGEMGHVDCFATERDQDSGSARGKIVKEDFVGELLQGRVNIRSAPTRGATVPALLPKVEPTVSIGYVRLGLGRGRKGGK